MGIRAWIVGGLFMGFGGLIASFAIAQEPIRIGVLLPATGVFGVLGKDQTQGLEMGFDDFGREVGGRPIKLIYGDTESKPNAGLAQAKKLILKYKVDLLVGVISSAVAGAVRDYVHRAQVPLVITNAGNNHITGSQCSPWIVRVSFSNSQIVRKMGPYLVSKGYRNAFLLAFDYAAGHQMMDAFRAGFESVGGVVIGEEYPPLGETKDFAPYLAKIKNADPDVVFTFLAGGPAIKFVKEWSAFRMGEVAVLSGAGWLHSALYVDKQGQDAIGTIGILNYYPSIDTPENQDFQRRFQAEHNRNGTEFGVAAYDGARLIVTALQAVNGRTNDKAALVKAMHNAEFNGPRGPFRIDPKTNNVIQNIYIAEVVADGEGSVRHSILDTIHSVQDERNGCTL